MQLDTTDIEPEIMQRRESMAQHPLVNKLRDRLEAIKTIDDILSSPSLREALVAHRTQLAHQEIPQIMTAITSNLRAQGAAPYVAERVYSDIAANLKEELGIAQNSASPAATR